MVSYCIAGASRGIGLQFVIDLLARGNVVIALARTPANAKGLQEIKSDKLHIIKADVTDSASLKAAAEETAKITGGSLDVLINNAYYQPEDPNRLYNTLVEFPDQETLVEDLNKNWNTNVLGTIRTTDAFLPLLRKGSVKKVLTLSSGMADPVDCLKTGYAKGTSYSISKSALEMVNVKYALALKDEGFIFLAISPGVVKTSSQQALTPRVMEEIKGMASAFGRIYPDWKGPMMPPESVAMMLDILDNIKPEDSGKFLSHKGNREWL